jgi:8-oxo-dGTP pyrophosphatase MutT (NUDIX family)
VSSIKTTGCGCAATRSNVATVLAAPTRSSRRPTSRWSSRPRTWSFPQGGFPAGQTGQPEELARLELIQETGFAARHLVKLGFLNCAHGITSQGGHFFLATGLEPGPPEREAEEQDMRQEWVPRARFEKMITQGLITDDSTVAAYGLLLMSERQGT